MKSKKKSVGLLNSGEKSRRKSLPWRCSVGASQKSLYHDEFAVSLHEEVSNEECVWLLVTATPTTSAYGWIGPPWGHLGWINIEPASSSRKKRPLRNLPSHLTDGSDETFTDRYIEGRKGRWKKRGTVIYHFDENIKYSWLAIFSPYFIHYTLR